MRIQVLFTHLDERLDLVPPLQLLRTHALRHFPGVPFHTGNNSMGIRAFLGALVELFDNDDFPASLAALEDDGNLQR